VGTRGYLSIPGLGSAGPGHATKFGVGGTKGSEAHVCGARLDAQVVSRRVILNNKQRGGGDGKEIALRGEEEKYAQNLLGSPKKNFWNSQKRKPLD